MVQIQSLCHLPWHGTAVNFYGSVGLFLLQRARLAATMAAPSVVPVFVLYVSNGVNPKTETAS